MAPFAVASVLAVVSPAIAGGYQMLVTVEADGVDIAFLIEAGTNDPLMEFSRIVEINLDQHPRLAEADLETILPKGMAFLIEL